MSDIKNMTPDLTAAVNAAHALLRAHLATPFNDGLHHGAFLITVLAERKERCHQMLEDAGFYVNADETLSFEGVTHHDIMVTFLQVPFTRAAMLRIRGRTRIMVLVDERSTSMVRRPVEDPATVEIMRALERSLRTTELRLNKRIEELTIPMPRS